MKMQSLFILSAALLSVTAVAFAADAPAKAGAAQTARAQTGAPMTQGEVKKVDTEAGKITIQHGPIANLDMPGMTMVFRVKEPALLSAVKAGDQIRFTAEKVGGALTVTQLEPAK